MSKAITCDICKVFDPEQAFWYTYSKIDKSLCITKRYEFYRYIANIYGPETLISLGDSYYNNIIGQNLSDQERAEEAALCYQESNTPRGCFIVGDMFQNHKIQVEEGESPFEKAAECYRKSDSSDAWANLGVLYQDKQIKVEEGESPFKKAAECFEQSSIGHAYLRLFSSYLFGYIGMDPEDEKRYCPTQDALIDRLEVLVLQARTHPNLPPNILEEMEAALRALKTLVADKEDEDTDSVSGKEEDFGEYVSSDSSPGLPPSG